MCMPNHQTLGEKTMKQLYLVRHGQTKYNKQGFIQGHCDSPLTELGRQQAILAGEWLASRGVTPQAIACSSLGRAFATCGLITSVLAEKGLVDDTVFPQPDVRLIERAYGKYERCAKGDFPFNLWDPEDNVMSYGGEGNATIRARMHEVMGDLLAADGVQTAIAVSHGSACRQFVYASNHDGIELPQRLPNCCIAVFDYDQTADDYYLKELADPCA